MDLGELADGLLAAYKGSAPGASIGIVKDSCLVLARSYGLANLSTGEPITTATNFRLASLTKAFTAVCVLKLVEEGKLGLEDNLFDLIPGMPDYTKGVTLRMMLGHISGVPDYDNDVPADYPGQVHEDYIVLKIRAQSEPLFPPGTRFQYSNTGYVLLAQIVERVSGSTFPAFLRRNVFEPLGMAGSTMYSGERAPIPNRAYGYVRRDTSYSIEDQSSTSATLGDGCIYSSVDDMLKWDAALRACGILGRELLEQAFTPGCLSGGGRTEYSFGWFITELRGARVLHHSGGTAGFKHKLIRVPERGTAIIILTNRSGYDLSLPQEANETEDSKKLLEYFELI